MNKEQLQQKAEEYANKITSCRGYPEDSRNTSLKLLWKRVEQSYLAGASAMEEEKDVFAMSFCAWYSHAEDAQVYKAQGLPAYKMLELYKSRPFLRTDSPQSN